MNSEPQGNGQGDLAVFSVRVGRGIWAGLSRSVGTWLGARSVASQRNR